MKCKYFNNFISEVLHLKYIHYKLKKDGWIEINQHSENLNCLGEKLCSKYKYKLMSSKFETLIPKKRNEIKKLSLSYAYGLNEFPLHTDGATYQIPPRFILLKSLSNSDTKTFLADTIDIKNNIITANSKWIIKTEKGELETKLIYQYKNNEIFRFNRLLMKSIDGNKKEVYRAINNLKISKINWEKNKILIIDNWRILHGREKLIEENYENRIMQRLQIFIE